mmetsp:Transcript_34024/g.74430  ORF Transcript_34024/g.74430 Transcript_34024/m.74430 type:complete len:178 (-) Transcript_34024:80-613(-)|eukprot:CAMPEP_0118934666 /NCGR_PEP_ID=MMETSP1169-20130426/13951_1 /TAXON_ID=36882 /ORGANISM="Pyramimonas obovata, Strain CCMP722" /LENGTH=177 /DNA_ID=CAMNT_0006877593 /DNA_START=90 /DNA_END=623 /DNA_ORIENTATION=-
MAEAEIDDAPEVEEVQKGEKGSESKALNRVTDHVQDKEMDANKVRSAMTKLAMETEEAKKRQLERDLELAKVAIKTEDVDIIADQFELDKKKAERILRENDGNVQQALKFLIDEWPESTPKVANDSDEYLQPIWPPYSKKKPLPTPPPPAKPAEPAKPAATAPVRPSTAKGKGKKKK